jgi:H/ACA ribonucleoprotein complex subunit 1
MGKFIHSCEGEMVCESINPKVPQFNAQMFLENKVRPSRLLALIQPAYAYFVWVVAFLSSINL